MSNDGTKTKWIDPGNGQEQVFAGNPPPRQSLSITSAIQNGQNRGCPRTVACRFSGDECGSMSVEFAVVGGIFLFFLLLVLLLALHYIRTIMLDLAVQTVSRNILVGRALTHAQFVADLQTASYGLLQGQTLYVAVQSAGSFGAITPVANISAGGSLPYSLGAYGSYVLVQAGFIDSTLATFLPGFVTKVSSAIAFQREPSPL